MRDRGQRDRLWPQPAKLLRLCQVNRAASPPARETERGHSFEESTNAALMISVKANARLTLTMDIANLSSARIATQRHRSKCLAFMPH